MFEILDCTLRDGGYYTAWDFDPALVEKYAAAMQEVGIDCVEIGYRSPPKEGYYGQYFYLNREDVQAVRQVLGDNQRISLMLNVKDLRQGAVRPLLQDLVGVLDLVRFACPPELLRECVGYAEEASALGFGCMVNIMYLNQWMDLPSVVDPLMDAGEVVQRVALVDSYGACFPPQVSKITRAVVERLPQSIGFHGHDNIQLAFANSLAALDAGAQILDATVLGMGRGAGNLRTELIVAYRDHFSGHPKVHFDQLADLLEDMEHLRREHEWGPNLAYAVAGFAGLQQGHVMEWLGKKRYAAASIISALRQSEGLSLDTASFEDVGDLGHDLQVAEDRPVVIIGGGKSAETHVAALQRFLNQRDAVVVHSSLRHAGLLADQPRQIFCFPGHEAVRVRAENLGHLSKNAILACVVPEPPRFAQSVPQGHRIVQVKNLALELDQQLGPVSDTTPLQLALSVAVALGSNRVYLYGFDGGVEAANAYPSRQDVQSTIDHFLSAVPGLQISSVTPTTYQVPSQSIYAFCWEDL